MTTLAEDFEAVASAHEQSITHAVIGEMGWRDGDERHAPGLARRGEVLTWDEARPLLDYYYNAGYGAPDCQAIYAWTAERVLFISEYDGSTCVMSVPAAPVACMPEMSGG